LRIEASATAVLAPTLSFVEKTGGNYSDRTRGTLIGSGHNVRLSESGERLMRLLIWPD
jgi:hypothetical protein